MAVGAHAEAWAPHAGVVGITPALRSHTAQFLRPDSDGPAEHGIDHEPTLI